MQKPDLIIENAFSIPNENLKEGDLVAILATVRNTGERSSRHTYVSFFLDSQFDILESHLINDTAIKNLSPGESAETRLLWAATPGNHTIRIKVDEDFENSGGPGLVSESNENNNEFFIRNIFVELSIPNLVSQQNITSEEFLSIVGDNLDFQQVMNLSIDLGYSLLWPTASMSFFDGGSVMIAGLTTTGDFEDNPSDIINKSLFLVFNQKGNITKSFLIDFIDNETFKLFDQNGELGLSAGCSEGAFWSCVLIYGGACVGAVAACTACTTVVGCVVCVASFAGCEAAAVDCAPRLTNDPPQLVEEVQDKTGGCKTACGLIDDQWVVLEIQGVEFKPRLRDDREPPPPQVILPSDNYFECDVGPFSHPYVIKDCNDKQIQISTSGQLPNFEIIDECKTDDPCKKPGCEDGPLKFDARCKFTRITECINYDGCCPKTCSAANDNDCQVDDP